MDTIPTVSSLAERKMKLLATCDLQREMLALELSAIRYRVSTLKGAALHLPKLLMLAAPIVGFLVARKAPKSKGLLAKGLFLATLARKGWGALRVLRRRS